MVKPARLYNAICAILEAKAEALKPKPAAKEQEPEHHPQGNCFSSAERRGPVLEPYEMHGQYRPGPYGQAGRISLRWWPEQEQQP